ncbi:MAG: type secretion system protein GspG [Pseudomonadota bacterium]|jgi:general secretion pathway protein G
MTTLHTRIHRLRSLSNAQNQRGLTLIEIIIVLVIIGIAMGFLFKNVFTMGDEARVELTKTKMNNAKGPLYLYQMRNNALPTDIRALENADTTDAWGRQITYRVLDGGRGYEMRSMGADGKDGGSGAAADIVVTGP